MKIVYVPKNFRDQTLLLIAQANRIIVEYSAQGFDLTLRQLYYQMVARDIIPNTDSDYGRLGRVIADGRMAGLVDWDAIEDRTRNLRRNAHWSSPAAIVEAAVESYRIDKWATQPYRPEVWIEKDALVGVVDPVCRRLDVPFFSCRGYTSASEMWRGGIRMKAHTKDGQLPIVFHLGDHDPSGIDMTRDIEDRLALFADHVIEVRRLALNRDQIDLYKPPPNPAKVTDSRSDGYIAEHGHDSWELDALSPTVLADLITDAVTGVRDELAWSAAAKREASERTLLREAARNLSM